MARFTVLGFTEAELGFVLATLFVAISGYQIVEARSAGDGADAASMQARSVQDSLADARAGLKLAMDSLSVTRDELEDLRRLTSRLTPYCSERGETDQAVARITVIDARTYRLDGASMQIAGVTSRLSRWLEVSKAKGCRFGVEVIPTSGLAADDFMRAREPLSRLFYFR
jgi:hypothetical protein